MKPFTHRNLAFFFLLGLVVAVVFSSPAQADTFGSGDNTFEIEFVTIGDPGNAADTTGDPNPAGAVAYTYRMGKYEISEAMIDAANAIAADAGEPLGISHDNRGPNKPATRVSWFEAAEFVNWLNTSKGSTPAYKFDDQGDFQLWEPTDEGYDPDNLFRNTEAHYFLPSADEWYKAAFYDPVTDQYFDFPNGSDTAPIPTAGGTDPNTAVYNSGGPADIFQSGGTSPSGTVAQSGNVWEWDETAVDLVNDDPLANRGFRGFAWFSVSNEPSGLSSSFRHDIQLPSASVGDLGFRIASIFIPEPATVWLAAVGCSALLLRMRRF